MDRQDRRIERLGSSVDYGWEHYEGVWQTLPDCAGFLGRLCEVGRSRGVGSRKAQRRHDVREEATAIALVVHGQVTEAEADAFLEGIGELAWPMHSDDTLNN